MIDEFCGLRRQQQCFGGWNWSIAWRFWVFVEVVVGCGAVVAVYAKRRERRRERFFIFFIINLVRNWVLSMMLVHIKHPSQTRKIRIFFFGVSLAKNLRRLRWILLHILLINDPIKSKGRKIHAKSSLS